MSATQNVAILINFHRVAISPVASRNLANWIAGLIREAEPGLIVEADPAAAVIDVHDDGSVLSIVDG